MRVVGVAWLPTFFVLSDVLIAAGSLALGGGRMRPLTPFRVLLPGAALGVLAFWPFLGAGAGPVFLLYLLYQSASILTLIYTGQYLGLYLDIGQAKRQLPALYALSSLGVIGGGLAVGALVARAGNAGLLAGWALASVAQLVIIERFDRRVKPLPGALGGGREQEGALAPLARRYRLFPLLLAFLGVSTVTFRLMDLHANRLLAQAYPTQEALSAFYGTFGAAGACVGAFVGWVVTPRMLATLGVGRTLLALPLACELVGVALAASPGKAAAIAARGCASVLRGALLNPTLDILRSALPSRLVSAAILVSSGLVIPAGTVVVWILTWAAGANASDAVLGELVLVSALALVALAPWLARAYATVLLQVLESRQLSSLRQGGALAIQLPKEAVEDLLRRVRGADPLGAELAAELLAGARDAVLANALREALAACREHRVARALLRNEDVLASPAVADLLVGRMAKGGAAAGGPTALAVVAEHAARRPQAGWLPLLEKLAVHEDPWVRAEALVGVARHRAIEPERRDALLADLASAAPERVRPALRAAAGLKLAEAIPPAVALLAHRELATDALGALAQLDAQPATERLEAYERAVASASPAAREAACALIARAPVERAVDRFVRLLARSQPSVLAQARAYLSQHWQEALPRVQAELASPTAPLGARREALALLAHWHQEPMLAAQAAAWTARGYAATLRLARLRGEASLSKGQAQAAAGFLDAVLAQRAAEAFALAAEAQLLLYRPSCRATVMHGLRSSDRGLRARALEALAASLPPGAAALARAFDDVPAAEMVEQGRRLGLLPPGQSLPPLLEELAADPDPYLSGAAAAIRTPKEGPGPMTTLDKLIFLKSVELFREFPVEDLHLIADAARETELAAGAELFRAGEPADRVWLLVSGAVTLYVETGGRFHLVTVAAERDAVGEVALFDGGGHPASARVDDAGTALVLERDDLLALVRDYPSLALAFLARFAQSMRLMQGRSQLLEESMTPGEGPR